MIIPVIGLCISPFLVARDLISWDYFDSQTIHSLFDTASFRFSPVLGGLIILEVIFNIAICVFVVLLLFLLFNKRSSFPNLMRLYLLFNAGFIIFELIIISPLEILGEAEMNELYTQLFRALVAAAIWIPYFTISDRAKGTFTNTFSPTPEAKGETALEKADSTL